MYEYMYNYAYIRRHDIPQLLLFQTSCKVDLTASPKITTITSKATDIMDMVCNESDNYFEPDDW